MKLRNILQNLGANLLITLFGLVGSIILARWLGPSQRGIFASIILIPTVLQYFVNFGLFSATIYFTAQPISNKNTIWSNLLIVSFIQSIVGILIGYFIISSYLQKYNAVIINLGYLYLLTVPLGLISMYATYMLQGASYFKVTNLLKCIVPVGYCLSVIVLKYYQNLTIENLVYVQIIIQSFYLIIALFLLHKILLKHFTFRIEYNFIRQMLAYSVKIWVGDVSQLANSRIDQFLIGGILSSKDLGIYTVAISVARFTSVFADAVKTIMLPSVTNKNSFQEKMAETLNFFKKYWIFSIFFHVIFILFLPFLVPFIFGNAYAEAVLICQILVVGSFFINAKTVLSGGVLGMGFPEMVSYVEVIGMIISSVLCFLMINLYGLTGVSIAIAISYSCQLIGLTYLMNNKGITYRNVFHISWNEFKNDLNWFKNAIQYFK